MMRIFRRFLRTRREPAQVAKKEEAVDHSYPTGILPLFYLVRIFWTSWISLDKAAEKMEPFTLSCFS